MLPSTPLVLIVFVELPFIIHRFDSYSYVMALGDAHLVGFGACDSILGDDAFFVAPYAYPLALGNFHPASLCASDVVFDGDAFLVPLCAYLVALVAYALKVLARETVSFEHSRTNTS